MSIDDWALRICSLKQKKQWKNAKNKYTLFRSTLNGIDVIRESFHANHIDCRTVGQGLLL